jgi:hypoxanthine phosphoribosyltransferase
MKKVYLTNNHIEKGIHTIVNGMYADEWRPDYIVGITRGGLIPAVMMSHLTGIKMYTLDVRLRDGNEQESAYWMAEDAFGIFQMGGTYEDKKILILDDINDTGATFQWIKEDWPAGCHPDEKHRWDEVWHKNVRFAALVNNLSSEFDVDYSSLEINKKENPEWIVFPHEEWW